MRRKASRRSTAAAPPARRAGGAREAFVILAMSVVALAVGLGLHLQAGLGGRGAAMIGVLVWGAMVLFHLAVRRSPSVADVAAELHRLDGEITSLRHVAGAASGPALPLGPALRAREPAVPQESMHAPGSPLRADARLSPDDAVVPRRPPPVPPALKAASRTTDNLKAAIDRVQKPAGQMGEAPPRDAGWDVRPGQQRATASSAPELKPAVFPPLHAGGEKTNPTPSAQRAENRLDAVAAAATRVQPPMGSTARSMPAAAPLTGQQQNQQAADAQAAGAMQTLIERLAKQLKAPASEAAPSVPQFDDAQRIIDHSVDVLRAAGGAMRAAVETRAEPEPAAKPVAQPAVPGRGMMPAGAGTAADGQTARPSDADIAEAVAARRIETYLESIADLTDQRTRHFEISLWLRTAQGVLVAPEAYALRLQNSAIAQIDTLKLARIAKIADRLKPRAPSALVFSTFGAQGLVDNSFLDTAAAVIADGAGIGRQIVLSFMQRDVRLFTDTHWKTLATMAEGGMRFAIMDLTDLAMDFSGLKARGFDFARLNAATLLNGMRGQGGTATGADISGHLTSSGLGLMAHGIDDDERFQCARGLRLLYGQGARFGGARPVTADLGPGQEAAA